MTVNSDGWNKQPHYTQHELDVMKRMFGSQLVSVTNPILKNPLESCSIGLDRKELHDRLLSAMEHYQGIGLSANQIGIQERAFIMYSDIKKKETITCFDPLITEYHLDKIIMDEGCLTWPGLWLKVPRSEGIRCLYYDVDGELVQVEMHGLESRIFQHEYDHMEGTDFKTRATRYHMEKGLKNMKLMNRKRKRNAA